MNEQPRILVVDDDLPVRNFLHQALRREGWPVAAVADGQEAIALLEKESFDTAILDWKMPGLNGMEVLERFAARWPQMAVVFVTGYGDTNVAIEATKKGAEAYLEKPFRLLELVKVVRGLLEKRNTPDSVLALHMDQFVKDNLADPDFKLRRVLDAFGFGKTRANKLFKEAFSMTFQQRLVWHRMSFAKHLLETTNEQVGQIGYACGFHSQQRFRDVFFRLEGVPPRQYRKNYRLGKLN